jgi:integrase
VAGLLYGSGLRLLEALSLRVKDLDFTTHEIRIRDGKGRKDRVTPLPISLEAPLRLQYERARALHERDLADGFGAVALPDALARKFPRSARVALAVVFLATTATASRPPASSAAITHRDGGAARDDARGARVGARQAGELPHVAP